MHDPWLTARNKHLISLNSDTELLWDLTTESFVVDDTYFSLLLYAKITERITTAISKPLIKA